MGSSRKHKKHKDKDKKGSNDSESNSSEQKPLRLVLKVPTVYSQSANNAATTSANTSTNQSTNPLISSQDMDCESPPKLMAFSTSSDQISNSSSLKKVKKKKSKKKHRKHSHHHSRHRHHSHHRRHHGSCSHHSRQSQDSNSASTFSSLVAPNKSPQKSSSSSSKSSTKSQFQQFLSHLLKQLQRKDVQQFFAWPVSDMIAPGYSSIISHPMDLSTMKQKIDQNLYETLLDFKADVKLICDNCMKYNRPETVYYKAANKLWHYTKNKLLNKDSLIDVCRAYPGLSSYELGFHIEESNNAMIVDVDTNDNRVVDLANMAPMAVGDTLPLIEEPQVLHEAEVLDEDGMTPEQILEEAKKAAQMAADRLTLERPNGAHFSFLRQRLDGSTTLSIVGNHSYEQNVNLEALAGKLNEGTAALAPFREAEINRVKPIESVNESPFCSYLPSLDSSRATLNEEDTKLLLSTYGDDEFGLQYAQSITQFAHETDYVLNLVDSLLDILTHGQHTKIAVKLRERQKSQESQSGAQNVNNESSIETINDEIQEQLNETGSLIGQLESLQYQRLSSSTQVVKPSSEEEKLASQLTSKLTDIIGSCSTPKDVSDINSIRKAMGIKIKTEK